MKTEHKYAQVLRWIADGERIQWNPGQFRDWRDVDHVDVFNRLSEGNAAPPENFRLKPRTITVNGREVQAGETVAPAKHSDYWTITFDCETMVDEICWVGDRVDLLLLERGLVHLTKEAAIAHAKAMLNID